MLFSTRTVSQYQEVSDEGAFMFPTNLYGTRDESKLYDTALTFEIERPQGQI